MQKLLIFFFNKNISVYAIFNDQSFNDTLTNDIVVFEQLGPAEKLRSASNFHNLLEVFWKTDLRTFLFYESVHKIKETPNSIILTKNCLKDNLKGYTFTVQSKLFFLLSENGLNLKKIFTMR